MVRIHYTIEPEFRREVAEHEVLISFNNDMDAARFLEWFDREGYLLLEDYAKENG